MKLVLHGYFRSGTSYRVRLALNWKGLAYETAVVNLVDGGQRAASYLARNPQGLVPALEADGRILTQSPAIIEWIEETWPERPLLPADPYQRARVRAFAAAIGCDIHPIQNLRVMKKLRADHGADQDGATAWARHWIETGFTALEVLAADAGGQGGFIFGDGPSLAEIYLLPQMFNARRFGVDLAAFPRLVAADEAARALPELAAAAPELQPDAV
ncbi:maleylacetoacetate isomerase [Alkalicaulis satelles]|uniref:Maleylacetoacetate isomerase n=1 Tax=Alkalicaulis satelles TaxID=2609175 RepID=A0A5M6ZIJ3_9PROT|nr:maleylacetoacetate isomerase [Alkalicaulis satelles]KAA5804652.1 maleylacetoacetate isomerase [Alkalicaulis satelles]